MAGPQGGIIAKGDINSNQIINPSNVHQAVIHRDKAANGLGKYYGKLDDGTEELIGGFGVTGGGVPFANDTDPLADVILVSIPGATPTDGYIFEVNILTTNTGATLLNITQNGLGSKQVVDSDGNLLVGGELVNESIYLFAYDLQNDRYQLLGLAKPTPVVDECFEDGTGLESCQQINTLTPNDASGDHSIAMGSGTTAGPGENAHSEGDNTVASGDDSHAEGELTNATGGHAHAEGEQTTASGPNSHAEGLLTGASGTESHAEGVSTLAIGANSHAEGNSSRADGISSHAEGSGSNSVGLGSHAEGNATSALGASSHSEGQGSVATGAFSHAEGANALAVGDISHAEGDSTLASGVASHAEGGRTIASGLASHSGGNSSGAVIGAEVLASGIASFNHSENTAAQTIGDGAIGDNSAILGGIDSSVDAASPRSVALGGNLNKIVGEPDTVQIQNLRVTTDLRITQGANKPVGTEALIAGTKTVLNTLVKATSKIFLTRNTIVGIIGIELSVPDATITPGVSFVVNSTDAVGGVVDTDDSTFNYLIINP